MPGFLPSLAGLSVPTGVKRVKEVSSDEDAARTSAPAPARPRGPRPESEQQRRLLKAARLKRPFRPSPSPEPEPEPARGDDPEQQRGRSRTVEASDDESGTEKADSDANSDTEADDETDDDAGVDGDAPMAVVIAPPSAAGPAGRLADLQQRKRDIEASLVTLEQLQEAKQAATTAKLNVATNKEKQKAASAQVSKRGDEAVAQEQAQNAHKVAKSNLAEAKKRQKTDNAPILQQQILDLEAAAAAAQTARHVAEKRFQAARDAVRERLNVLAERAGELARTALKNAEALAQLKQKKAEDEKALKEINSAIKSASLYEKKESAEAQKEAKAAQKQANAAAKQAEMEAAKQANAAAKQAEKEAKEKAEKCEELACEIHRFRYRMAEDLRAEAEDITNDLKKNDWCEAPDGEDQLAIPTEDAAWFKELVRFVEDTQERLKRLIDRNQDMDGERLDWRSNRHEYMLNDICPEGGGEDESSRLGKLVGSDSELEGELDEDFIDDDEKEADSEFTDEEAELEWNKKDRMAALKHIKSGEHKKEMYALHPARTRVAERLDGVVALAGNQEGKTTMQRELEKAEQTGKDELKAPASPEMQRRNLAQVNTLGRDEPAAPSAASTAEEKKKKRITPQRTDEDPPEGGD